MFWLYVFLYNNYSMYTSTILWSVSNKNILICIVVIVAIVVIVIIVIIVIVTVM